MRSKTFPEIDLVYTWVDGADPEFQASLDACKSEYTTTSSSSLHWEAVAARRFREMDNLRYSLRSVARNLPWVRKIFIVTNGQVPHWLQEHDCVSIIRHEDIFEDPKVLPSFNPFAIEWCLPNISDLRRYFIYCNDDFFFTRPTLPEYFFGENGLPKLLFSDWTIERADQHSTFWDTVLELQMRRLDNRFKPRKRYPGAHGPCLFDQEQIFAVRSIWNQAVTETLSRRFRDQSDVQLLLMYVNTLMELDETKPPELRHEMITLGEELRLVHIGQDELPWRQELRSALANPPRFLCLNDDGPSGNIRRIEAAHAAFLKSLLPEPSPFEKKRKSFFHRLTDAIRNA